MRVYRSGHPESPAQLELVVLLTSTLASIEAPSTVAHCFSEGNSDDRCRTSG